MLTGSYRQRYRFSGHGLKKLLLAVFFLFIIFLSVYMWRIWESTPKGEWAPGLAGNSVVYDEQGSVITTLHGTKNSIPVTLDQVPPDLQLAVIAVEDHNFYINSGFDPTSIVRAALADIEAGLHPVQGGSTITEQLAKELFLSDKKTVSRKLKEFILGLELQHWYTKSQILQKYLNVVYFGQGAYGIGAASRAYFGTSVTNLNLAQSSLLAGLINAPTMDDPIVHPNAAKARQSLVLADMARYGFITAAQEKAAMAEKLHFLSADSSTGSMAPYFADYVIEYLNVKLGLPLKEILGGGLRIYTTLDPKVQTAADQAVAKVMNGAFGLPSGATPNPQAAALVMDPRNGYILAMVGGRTHPGILIRNRAITGLGPYEGMLRQPGSSIKPLFTYTPAIVSGLTEMSVIDDIPFSIVNGGIWPENDDHLFRGYMTLRHGLAISDNNVAVRTLSKIGVNYGFSFAYNQFHLTTLVPSGARNDDTLAATLGGLTKGVSLQEMVTAYSELANGGTRIPAVAVLKVEKADGSVIYQYQPEQTREFSPQAAYIVTKMLEKVLAYGTGSGFPLNRPAAGKTGTTNNGHNGWFIGYTPQMVTGVWTGYSDRLPKPATGFYGATYAGPIWHDIMSQALAGRPVEHFVRPSGIVTKDVSDRSGLLPGPFCPPRDIKQGLFIQGTQPVTQGDAHVQAVVCAQNPRLLWTANSGDTPETEIFWRRPSQLLAIPPGIAAPDIIARDKWVPDTYAEPAPVKTISPGGNGVSPTKGTTVPVTHPDTAAGSPTGPLPG